MLFFSGIVLDIHAGIVKEVNAEIASEIFVQEFLQNFKNFFSMFPKVCLGDFDI